MTSLTYRLPDDLALDIDQHAHDVERFLQGDLTASILKSRRVPRGIYEQRQNSTFMMRVRLPGGAISASQSRELAAMATRYSSGTLHVTTRQDIQLHDVKIDQTPEIMREMFKAGLTTRGGGGNTVRNITACPYAGICPAERFDVSPYVMAVTEYLIGLPGSYNLPRKYKIAFSGCSADCALAVVNDLGFIAKVRDGTPGFVVYAGGGMGAESRIGELMEEWVPAGEVIRVAEAVRRLFDRLGDRRNRRRARLRFAVERIGADVFLGMLRETIKTVKADGVPSCEARPELADAPSGIRGDFRSLLTHAGGREVLRQRQAGYVAVPVRLPLGQITAKSLASLADIAERFSADKMLHVTQDQHLLLRFVKESDLGELGAEMDRVVSPAVVHDSALHAFTACTGAATCRLGLCLSQDAAVASAHAVAASGIPAAILRTVDIRINGCPNACGQHPVGTIGLFGAAHRAGERLIPAYRVLLGARRGEGRVRFGLFAGIVPARSLPAFLVDLLGDYNSTSLKDEAFADFYDRKGMAHFQSIIGRYTSVKSYAVAPEFYRDWGRDDDFALAGRGAGECGAGVFEVISEDLATAAKALEQADKDEKDVEALFRGLLATARALLITRGVDIQNPDEVFKSFETHFVETGLVDAGFRGLLTRAMAYREGWHEALVDRRGEIRNLLRRIEYLFSTMDADLKFNVKESSLPCSTPAAGNKVATHAAAVSAGRSATVEIDLRGVACPMNFVKAKLMMETMDVGATLGVLLDDGEPVRNVPASFQNEGQEVLETCAACEGHWRVVIMKARG